MAMSAATSRACTPHQAPRPGPAGGVIAAGPVTGDGWGGGRKMPTGAGGKSGRAAVEVAVERVCGMGVWAVCRRRALTHRDDKNKIKLESERLSVTRPEPRNKIGNEVEHAGQRQEQLGTGAAAQLSRAVV